MIGKLLFHIISGVLGLYLATRFVPGVELTGQIKNLFIAGAFLGLVTFFVRPILEKITLPLRILTLGLFSLLINMLLVWVVADILFPEAIEIKGLVALFWTTIIILALNYFFGLLSSRKNKT